MRTTRFAIALLLIMTALPGCSKPSSAPASTHVSDAPAPAASQAATPARPGGVAANVPGEPKKACELVTAEEMSGILGAVVAGVEPGHKSSGKTECIYKPAAAPNPYVEFSVEWGEGELALSMMGTMGRAEPGITNPYEGIGDQAASVGTALMIRSGKDLITITFSGVSHAPAKARKIFDTAKARM